MTRRQDAPVARRRMEGRCHVCQFIREHPVEGELLEAKILDPREDLWEVSIYFNERYEFFQGRKGKHKLALEPKKLKTHKNNHLKNPQEIFRQAREKGLTGNITLEKSVMDQMAVLDALSQRGIIRVQRGEIGVDSLGDLLTVFTEQRRLMGGDKIEIKIGGTGGLNIPPHLLTEIVRVMSEFVPSRDQPEMRRALDEKVFPLFKQYAESWESSTGQSFDARQIAEESRQPVRVPNVDVEATAVEEEEV